MLVLWLLVRIAWFRSVGVGTPFLNAQDVASTGPAPACSSGCRMRSRGPFCLFVHLPRTVCTFWTYFSPRQTQ